MHKLILGVAVVISTVAGAAEDLPVTDVLKLHYDASAEGTILRNDAGAVTNWAPVTGTMPLVDANTAYPEATYPKSPVTVVTENGRKGLLLSHYDNENNGVYTFMCFPDVKNQATFTLFVVSRQIDAKYYGSIVGRPSDYTYRLQRDSDRQLAWRAGDWDGRIWINGQETTEPSFADCGGTTTPHVLTATSSGGKWLESLGASAVVASSGSTLVYDKCVVHEVIYYGRVLTDDEIVQVSRYLIAKWGLVNPFPCTWTGAGQTSNWSDADNWDGGLVPGAKSVVKVADGTTITLDSAEIDAARIEPSDEGTVTLTLKATDGLRVSLNAEIDDDVNLAFAGPGTLVCNDSISACAPITLKGGTVAPVAFSAAKYGTVSTHLDASVTSSIDTNEQGEVRSWASQDGGICFKSPLDGAAMDKDATITYIGAKNRPIFATSANGKPCVRFGRNADGEFTPSLLRGDSDFKTYTVFCVGTRYFNERYGRLFGHIYDDDGSVLHLHQDTKLKDYYTDSSTWCNGETGTGGITSYEASGTSRPFVFVSRRVSSKSWAYAQTVGAANIQNGSTVKDPDGAFGRYDLHELITYSTALTDDQIREVAVYLMNKWGAPRQAADYRYEALPAINPVLTADATLDSGFFDFTLSSLTIDAGGLSTAPCLSVLGAIDLGRIDLALTGIRNLENDPKILTATNLSGDSPKSVSGLLGGFKLKKSGDDLFLKCPRGLLLLVR